MAAFKITRNYETGSFIRKRRTFRTFAYLHLRYFRHKAGKGMATNLMVASTPSTAIFLKAKAIFDRQVGNAFFVIVDILDVDFSRPKAAFFQHLNFEAEDTERNLRNKTIIFEHLSCDAWKIERRDFAYLVHWSWRLTSHSFHDLEYL